MPKIQLANTLLGLAFAKSDMLTESSIQSYNVAIGWNGMVAMGWVDNKKSSPI